ncbi:MAG: hypothetical protein JO127_03560 [Caulobacteraceae bacterium]|nr:hypothetical protein [Caulobacteraceae bacterium]
MFGRPYQLGYVTGDLSLALQRLGERQGLKNFVIEEQRRPGSAVRRVGKGYAGPMMLEIMEVDPAIPSMYGDRVSDDPAEITLHHLGYMLDDPQDLDRVRAWCKARSLSIDLDTEAPGVLAAIYADTRPALGHYSEFVHLMPGGAGWYDKVPANTP